MASPSNNPKDETSLTKKITGRVPMFITKEDLDSILPHQNLIEHFQSSLSIVSPTISSPMRQSHTVQPHSSLLLMPSWSSSPALPYIGVKLVTHFPQNSALNLPAIHASYSLFSSTTGQTLTSMDGTTLTLYRTSCISGLAAKYLARPDSRVMVMVGAGALGPHLIKAHLAARPSVRKVIIWNRTEERAKILADEMRKNAGMDGLCFESTENLDDAISMADIVSCATNSEVPLVKGDQLKAGAYLNLVGSFKHSMSECDDLAIKRGRVFVDSEAALEEAGELVGALERGVIEKRSILGNLVDLIKGEVVGRRNEDEITVFKSVGSAVFDLVAAQFAYERSI
ncbi:protein SAR DEFICIENT 4-like [Cucurbita maxima]|uniref:Protein SAR DEFICIENT 4-like n=1 Tax=Cucurbita maxima TaxID=3661 RepID=A0A6J1J2T7_CUCMA|nr:protein SAR DEFICIENT 4-like [Cucurbita maxima]XP_022984672.1 protein SAR DEFICIENT 4-like [Cucurbita maxima]